jgi:hypothetical protein
MTSTDYLSGRQPTAPTISVRLHAPEMEIEGKVYQLEDTVAAIFLQELTASAGSWVSGPDIIKNHPELEGTRFDRIKKDLPEAIRDSIESQSPKGFRWTLGRSASLA